MSEEINVNYVKGGYSTSDDVVLCTTPTTRVVYRPAVHSSGVRGEVIRQKIGADKTWKDTNEADFRVLPPDAGVAVDIDTDGTRKLFEKLQQLYQIQEKGTTYGQTKYIVAEESEVVLVRDETKRQVIQELLEQGYTEEFWSELADSNPSLASKLAAAQIQLDKQRALKEFSESISDTEKKEDYWQDFFEKNTWMLESAFSAPVIMLAGETYVGGKLPVGRNGQGGVATDFLFADDSTKSFAVVEIKTPDTPLVGALYRGTKGSGQAQEIYSMDAALTGGLVQTRTQISTAINHFSSVLGEGFEYKLNHVHPRGVLIIGCSEGLGAKERDSFNQFRQGLYAMTIITFDELLSRLKSLYAVSDSQDHLVEPTETLPTDLTVGDIWDDPIDLSKIPF